MRTPQDAAHQPRRATFSTDAIEPAHRFEAWRGLLGLTHEIGCEADNFHARVTSTPLDRMIASEMFASPQSVARSPQRIRRDGLDHITLHLTTSAFDVEMGDARFRVPAGAITVNTLSRPFRRSAASERGSFILSLSRDLVAETLPDPEVFHGQVLHRGVGLLFAEHMRTLVRHGHDVEPSEMPGLARATAQLLSASLEPSRPRSAEAGAARDAALAVRCKRDIERHLQSPSLNVETICRRNGLSRSALYRLFAESGGVSVYIQARRLDAARKALRTMDKPRVSDVAYAYGFTNSSAFSRAFRDAFGTSPSEAAAESGAGDIDIDIFRAWMDTVTANERDAG